jgi:transcription-repair coupling factor (superfamily II helicase)
VSDLALPVRQVEDDELFNPLGAASAQVFVSQAFTPFALAAAVERFAPGRTALIVAADDTSARDLAADLAAFLPGRSVRAYPARGVLYESHLEPPPHLVGLRIAALDSLTSADSDAIVVVSAGALAERVPDPALRPHGFKLSRGDVAELDELARDLVANGYERVDRVEDRGQFATRGDIIDVFPSTGENAVRIEFFDIEIESLRRFSTFTQRSLEGVESVELEPATELAAEHREAASQALADHENGDDSSQIDIAELLPIDRFHALLDLAPDDTWLAVSGREDVEAALAELWADIEATYHDAAGHGLYVPPEELLKWLEAGADLSVSNLTAVPGSPELRAERPASMARSFEAAEIEVEKLLRSGYRTIIAWSRRSELERAEYNLARVQPTKLEQSDNSKEWAGVFFTRATLREGFVSPALKLAIIPDRLLLRTAGGSAV